MRSSATRKLLLHLPALVVLACIAIVINVRHLNEPPAYIHAWTQADNYSLALGFLHNGGDLFHPQTLIYNKQQKDPEMPQSLVTACDLPLHHWCASLLMRITGSTQPWLFRGWTLFVSILGLWCLYLCVFLLTRSSLKALLVAVICATSPSFAYYSASFIPTVPALSCAIAGLAAYMLHVRKYSAKWLSVSVALLTLAMMQRTSLAVLWVAVAAFHFLRLLRHEAVWRQALPPFLAGASVFVAYYLWNIHLRNEYGSLFLSSLLPASDLEQAHAVLLKARETWRYQYFLRMDYWVIAAVVVAVVVCKVLRVRRSVSSRGLSSWWLLAIWLFGELLFGIAMLRQYKDHDYYFLDSFFLPLLMLVALLLRELPNPRKLPLRLASTAAVVSLTVLMTVRCVDTQRLRRNEGLDALDTAIAYKSANRLLQSAGLGPDTRLLALLAYPQNTPFCMMNRAGYAVMWPNRDIMEPALQFPFEYIIIEDQSYRNNYEEAADVLNRLQRIAGNDTLSLCLLSDSTLHHSVDDFFAN